MSNRTCTIDGCERGHQAKGLCSNHYSQEHRRLFGRKKVERTCERCGSGWLVEPASLSRFCSMVCAKADTRRTRSLVHVGPAYPVCWLPAQHPATGARPKIYCRVFVGVVCAWCNNTFVVPGQTTARYCSRKCSRAFDRSKRGRFSVPPAIRWGVYERDQWTCQLCLEPVDESLAFSDPTHDWAPSLDHVIPQSKGGTHEPSNLRLAHRWCNAVRGAEDYHADLFVAA